MVADVKIVKINESYLRLDCELDVAMELSEAFSFQVPGYKFNPKYKSGQWDGYIRLFNLGRRTIYSGLWKNIVAWCESREYTYELMTQKHYLAPGSTAGIDMDTVKAYMDSLELHGGGKRIAIRDYQVQGVQVALDTRQGILLSSVGSGKSLMLYVICRYITEVLGQRVLLIVPTVGLTTQMRNDFADYASAVDWDVDDHVHMISSGVSKDIKKPIVISTYQSIYKMPAGWFNGDNHSAGFGAIICDEGHKIQAATIAGIYERATEVPYRLACTGTMQEMKCNILTMIGLTGTVHDIASSKKLIEAKQLVPLRIKGLVLDYPKETCKAFSTTDYESEIKFLTTNRKRNEFISKLAVSCKGTTLVLFRFVELQGQVLYDMIGERATNHEVQYVDGGVHRDAREQMRTDANNRPTIVIASYGVFSAGVNVPSIENIIFAHPFKSKITGLQSIGRGLRLKEGKTECVLYDIADNMTFKNKPNNTFNHFGERLKMYSNEGFDFNIINIPFKDE